MRRGALIAAGVAVLGGVGAWTRGATARDRLPHSATSLLGEHRALEQSLAAAQGEVALAHAQLDRANAVIFYSTGYGIPADVAAAVYDIALSEGLDPALAFRLVRVESGFDAHATSAAGAVGYTQILPSTARLYEPGLTPRQLFDRETNLRLGLRYLRDLLERFEGTTDTGLRLALLAYNRGPAKVQELLDAGRDPQNGYATAVMQGYRSPHPAGNARRGVVP
jgi:soluble lytic murein transglycosylase-like protein